MLARGEELAFEGDGATVVATDSEEPWCGAAAAAAATEEDPSCGDAGRLRGVCCGGRAEEETLEEN